MGLGATIPLPRPAPADAAAPEPDALEALVNATAIKNAVRLQPLGYRPGMTGGRVGLLEGLRTPDMDKYDEVSARCQSAAVASIRSWWHALCGFGFGKADGWCSRPHR